MSIIHSKEKVEVHLGIRRLQTAIECKDIRARIIGCASESALDIVSAGSLEHVSQDRNMG